MTNSIARFSDRVDNYVKYRPDYPVQILSFLVEKCGLSPSTVVADIGCGTGISSRLFLENGNVVFGVEPNRDMRNAAVEHLSSFDSFSPIDGTASHTTLPDESVDLIIAAQAFHWFEPLPARAEFQRILMPGGHTVLIWNERQLNTTPFLVDYEALILKFGRDYGTVRHENIEANKLQSFFGGDYGSATFENFQIFDFEGLKGRLLSASYMPNESDKSFDDLIKELKTLFAKHVENGRIKIFYDTNLYYSPA